MCWLPITKDQYFLFAMIILIAIIDATIADISLPGMQKTTNGLSKIVDCFDFSCERYIDISTVKEVDFNNTLFGLSGLKLKIPSKWKNPSGKWYLGLFSFYSLCFKNTNNVKENELLKAAWKEKVENERAKILQNVYLPYADCIVWFDGKKWRACIDTPYSKGLENAKILTNYQDEHEFGFLWNNISYCIKIHNQLKKLEIMSAYYINKNQIAPPDYVDHSTAVSHVAAAHFPNASHKDVFQKRKVKMKWCFCFSIFIVIFHLQFCYSTYIFTQYDYGTHVCKSADYYSFCPRGTAAIFIGYAAYHKKNMPMNLGFLNLPSDKFYDDYNMTEYGFPIFYKYHWKDDKLNVDFIIANGKRAPKKQGEFFYVSLIDEEKKCRETRPKSEKETLSGALYLNQKFAKYAYFIYQSASSSTCISTIEFEDLFQGDLRTLAYGTIKPKEINRIPKIIENFYYPFFTIDPIFGTMVYLVRDGNELSAVHYIINENRIKYFEQVFPLELRADPNNPTEIVWYLANPDIMFERGVLPVFTSYGKSTFFFLPKSGEGGGTSAFGFWTASKVQESYVKVLHYDNHRHFYYLNYGYFENGEPFGKYVESTPLIPLPYALESSALVSNCEEEISYLGLFIAFAVIDFLLMFGLLGLGITIWFGSKKMKRLRHLQNQRHGKIPKQLTVYGETTATTVAQPSAKTDGKGTIAPTDLNTQFTTTKAITVTRGGINTKTTNVQANGNTTIVTKQQQTTNQVTAGKSVPVPTKTIDGKKTTMLQTWK